MVKLAIFDYGAGNIFSLKNSFEQEGAVAEVYFHLSRQPVFPSLLKLTLNQISVKTEDTLKFADLNELKPLGVDTDSYKCIGYRRTQEIADAAFFLGFDGIIAPSARWPCLNMVIFTEHINKEPLELVESIEVVNWDDWKKRIKI